MPNANEEVTDLREDIFIFYCTIVTLAGMCVIKLRSFVKESCATEPIEEGCSFPVRRGRWRLNKRRFS